MSQPRNLSGGAWLIADMSLNIWALVIVKSMGLDIPSVQLVFLRALSGLVLILPWIWVARDRFRGLDNLPLHALRVGLSAVTLTSSFFAVARLPLALFSAIQFTRPVVTMVLATLILREVIPRRRWWAAAAALVGAGIAIGPTGAEWSWGLPAAGLVVLSGTGAIIVTRRLHAAPRVVMMTFYTAGLAVCTAPFALTGWVPVPAGDWPTLLAIGVFAQSAQFCFLAAHARAEAGFLSVLGYLSLPLTTTIGFLIFGEAPEARFYLGAAFIIASALAVAARPRATRQKI
ncbi:S-adenosylmethionine uptake transporter [Monaibacterium marinum]|uniref:S-adenosylmethionine uptake transporter n=1 Tax=Pontivivens marinum TaxID=1690039 RepID=A0A2C9CQ27_9RHOB|nr:DMT family transporter [Monaibacterium marinum]SOH93295.1 S-adenosylmethionine uptake transporter [Monaibacterium marinum]